MTDPRDPIEGWLGADVELMPPRPGEFERVRQRARRRKTMSAMTAAAGVAVVIAAAVVVPQVTGLLHSSPGPSNINPASRSHSPKPNGSPTPHSSATRYVPSKPGPALPTSGPGLYPPATAFQPTSVTFIGSVGAVIGQAHHGCPSAACTAVAGTADYGTSWTKMGAPAAGAPDGASGVSQIRFNTQMFGWAYGPALYATTNGGATWHRQHLPGRVIDLATVNGFVLAVVATCSGTGPHYASGCTSFQLYRTAENSGGWTPVTGASGTGAEVPGGLQLAPNSGSSTGSGTSYLLAGGQLFTGPVGRGAWHRVRTFSGKPPPCLSPTTQNAAPAQGRALLAPTSAAGIYLACDVHGNSGSAGRVTLYMSPDSGGKWGVTGSFAVRGKAESLAAIAGGNIVLATTDGLYFSTYGTSWSRAGLSVRVPGGFRFVGLTTASDGVAVPVDRALGEVLVTTDGGTTWQASKIR